MLGLVQSSQGKTSQWERAKLVYIVTNRVERWERMRKCRLVGPFGLERV